MFYGRHWPPKLTSHAEPIGRMGVLKRRNCLLIECLMVWQSAISTSVPWMRGENIKMREIRRRGDRTRILQPFNSDNFYLLSSSSD